MKKLLFTSLIFVLGLSAAHATKRYVGFGTHPASGADLHDTLTVAAASGKDTVYVAAGVYNSGNAPFVVAAGVKLIGGYAKNDSATLTRRYPGQFMFLPTGSSDLSNTTEFTVLDGNSLKTKASQKHRVLEVVGSSGDTGVVDGCLIRNGHVRNDNGGGVLLKGGKLYNSVVRGNVAMADHPDSLSYDPATKVKKGSLGGGVYITNNGEMVNCLVAYNMANDGFGVALGTGGGKTINNTLTANTYAPFFAKIEGSTIGFKMMYSYAIGGAWHDYRGTDADTIPKVGAAIKITKDFYLSRTLTTQSQYAVFCAAIDIIDTVISGTIHGQFSATTLSMIEVETKFSGATENNVAEDFYRIDFGQYTFLRNVPDASPKLSGLTYANGIWHPHLNTLSMEYPMGYVSWHGALAYCLWLGGGLPTDARWEFAARRNPAGVSPALNENLYSGAYGTTSTTPIDTWRILDSIAWMAASVSIDTATGNLGAPASADRVHEVARKRPNAVGLYDMTGLMSEWCADYPHPNPILNYNSGGDDPKPFDHGDGDGYSLRGGSWSSTNRYEFALGYLNPTSVFGYNETIGFRPFIDLAQQP